jgi:glycosyltransferase involved in cell wall biosynthesis
MQILHTGMLHYSAPPIVGGVEGVIQAHARVFSAAGYPVTVLAGRGQQEALPDGARLLIKPEIDSLHPEIVALSTALAAGRVPADFDQIAGRLAADLEPLLAPLDALIVHNVFTKQFNLPLTAALFRLLDAGAIQRCIAWCHDLAWTSPRSRAQMHSGYPWDLLRIRRSDLVYVVVSQERQADLAGLFGCPPDQIHVVYNGVDPAELLALSPEGQALIDRLDLWQADLILLMPVRVTQAKNIELALEVIAALKARVARPRLILTGPPDPHDKASMAYYHSLQARRQALGVDAEMRFVFESGPDPNQPYLIDLSVVSDLYRVADVMFMPSHREGFAMPVLEAGLVGIPVVATAVPAAQEIGQPDVLVFDLADSPAQVADRILAWVEQDPIQRLRRRTRQRYTWQAIFQRDILPILTQKT